MKVVIIVLLSTPALVAGRELPMSPTDEKMIHRFVTCEAAFDEICKIMAESSEGSFHYPPLLPCDTPILDPVGQISYQPSQIQDMLAHGLSRSDRIQLNSLLSETRCGLVLVDRREQETADSMYVSLFMLYRSHGIVDVGISRSFVYDLESRSRRDIRITEHDDLNETYRRTYNDTMLYESVKEGWYIELDRSR